MTRSSPRLNIAIFLGVTMVVLGSLVAFARYPALFRRGREYQAVFSNVAGLNVGDHVRYGGLLVGTVTSMSLDSVDPTHIRVAFRVKGSTPVRYDTRAAVTQVGLLGEPFLSLRPGRRSSPPMPVGGTLASDNNQSFQEAMNQLAEFFENTDTLFSGLDRLARASPFERIDRTLTRFDALIANTATRSDQVLRQLDQASRQLGTVLEHTDRLIAGLDSSMGKAGPSLAVTQREAIQTLRETRSLVSDLRDAMQSGGGVDQLMRNLAVATDNLARLSERLERDPTSILKKRRLPPKPAGPAVRE